MPADVREEDLETTRLPYRWPSFSCSAVVRVSIFTDRQRLTASQHPRRGPIRTHMSCCRSPRCAHRISLHPHSLSCSTVETLFFGQGRKKKRTAGLPVLSGAHARDRQDGASTRERDDGDAARLLPPGEAGTPRHLRHHLPPSCAAEHRGDPSASARQARIEQIRQQLLALTTTGYL